MQLKKMLLYLFATGVVASCTNDELLPESDGNTNSVENVVFTIEDWKVEPQTRSLIDFETGKSAWNGTGDVYGCIYVAPRVSGYGFVPLKYPLSSLTKSSYADGGTTSLSTTANTGWNMKNGVTYIAYYPALPMNDTGTRTPFELSIPSASRLTTNGFNLKNDVMWAKAKAESSLVKFEFKRVYSLIGVALVNLPAKEWKSLTISNIDGDNVFCTKGYFMVKTGTTRMDESSKFNSYSFSCPATTTNNNCLFTVFPTLPTTTGELLCVLEDCEGNKYEAMFSSITTEKGVFYPLSSTVSQTNVENGHEYIDLGLPSGLKWATMNLGATNEFERGKVYAWGETKGEGEEDRSNLMNYYSKSGWNNPDPYVKDFYSWRTYKWCEDVTNSNIPVFSKYTNNQENEKYGLNDYNFTLDSEDDAATQNWGGKWRMPTHDDLYELLTKCCWVWTDHYNNTDERGFIVYKAMDSSDEGRMVGAGDMTATYPYTLNDVHIFFHDKAFCWSSSLNEGEDTKAWGLCMDVFFGRYLHESRSWDRYEGKYIRPVFK